jgi:hypothetical protein
MGFPLLVAFLLGSAVTVAVYTVAGIGNAAARHGRYTRMPGDRRRVRAAVRISVAEPSWDHPETETP